MQAFSVGALVALQRWGRTGRARYAAAAGLLLGLGLCTRLHFAWFWTALAAAGLLWLREASWEKLRRPAAAFAAGGLLGLAPVIASEASLGVPGSKLTWALMSPRGGSQAAGSSFLTDLPAFFKKFSDLLDGTWGFQNVFSDESAGRYLTVVLAVAAAFLLREMFRRDAEPRRRRWTAACLVAVSVLLLQAAVVPSWRLTHIHLFFLYPFMAVLIAAASDAGLERFSGRAPWSTLARGLVAALFCLQAAGAARLTFLVGARGATGLYSDTVYDVARWLGPNRTRPGPVFCVDRELFTSLFFLRPAERAVLQLRSVRGAPAWRSAHESMRGWSGPGFYLLMDGALSRLPAWSSGPHDLRNWYYSFGRVRPVARFYDVAGECQAEVVYVESVGV
jgi:hypothetical protein